MSGFKRGFLDFFNGMDLDMEFVGFFCALLASLGAIFLAMFALAVAITALI